MTQVLLNGLIVGTGYALVALGLTIIFSIMRVVNFAHGQLYVIGGFVVYFLYAGFGLPFPLALVAAALCVGLLGVVLEIAFFRPVIQRIKREEATMLLAMGLALLLEHTTYLLFGELQRGAPPVIAGVMPVFDAYLSYGRLVVVLCGVALIVATILFINLTRPGRALRAMAQDREAALLQGVNLRLTGMLGFGIGAALAGIAGGLLVTVLAIHAGAGTAVSIKAFLMVMLGGAGVVSGAIIGGFVLGFAESIGYAVLPGSVTYLVIFAAMIVFLVFRPNGLVGRPWG